MKPVMYILGSIFIILMFSATLTGLNDFRGEDETEIHNSVATAAYVTSANVTLLQDLLDDDTVGASVSSNLTSDAPLSHTWTDSSNRLLVSGLTASSSRQLTVTYTVSRLSNYYAVDAGSKALPIMLLLGVLGIIAGAVYAATKGRD